MDYDLNPTITVEVAELYEVRFEINNKKFIYIGLDTKCNPKYYGSSLIIYHYKRIYGEKIFTKKVIQRLENIAYKELCELEQQYIKDTKKNAKKNKEHSVNYTGENKANVNAWEWMDI